MKQYRKKPVVIEAVQFDGLNPTEIKDFVGENCKVEIYDNEVTPPVVCIVIHTLEGDMEVSKGDYVIKGVKGEFYPCKPDIFEQTYESVEIKQKQPEVEWKEGFHSHSIKARVYPCLDRNTVRVESDERLEKNEYLYPGRNVRMVILLDNKDNINARQEEKK